MQSRNTWHDLDGQIMYDPTIAYRFYAQLPQAAGEAKSLTCVIFFESIGVIIIAYIVFPWRRDYESSCS